MKLRKTVVETFLNLEMTVYSVLINIYINTLNTTHLNFQTSNNMLQSDCIQDSFEELHQNFIGMYLQCNEKSYNQPLHRNI